MLPRKVLGTEYKSTTIHFHHFFNTIKFDMDKVPVQNKPSTQESALILPTIGVLYLTKDSEL